MSDQPFRWILGGLLAIALSLSGFFRSQAARSGERIARSREPATLILARAFIAFPLLGCFATFLVAPHRLEWAQLPLPAGLRWAGVILGVIAIPFEFAVLSALGRNISETVLTKAEHELVVRGPYAWIRHPLYATGLLLLTAITLMTASGLIGAITLVAAAGIIFVVIPREEAALTARFGDAYAAYVRRTGRLLPRRASR